MKEIFYRGECFSQTRELGRFYEDKTELLYELVREPAWHFLARPPGFFQTFLISTLEAILKGQRDLFKGLWIDTSGYDWTPYPVITLDMEWAITQTDPKTWRPT
jgi:hypothetical protein